MKKIKGIKASTIHTITRDINQDKECLIKINNELVSIKSVQIKKGKIIFIPDIPDKNIENKIGD
jgi:hypothetical protein